MRASVIPAKAGIQTRGRAPFAWIPAYAGMTLLLMLVAGCGIFSRTPSAPSGKYYADDGPPDKIPENLARIPDAEPRDEAFHRFANRPYTVFGHTYVPVVNKQPTRERGLASWYGRKFHGQKTASGETYDMFAMTAAHKTLPIPSFARVTNVKTLQSVVVRVNDRGPFHSDRIIDLSYAAAARIGIVNAGAALVDVERIIPGPGASDAAARPLPPPAPVATADTPVIAREAAGLWLQLGAFSSAETAESFRAKMAKDLPWLLEPISISSREGLHRVRLGPYANTEEATAIGDKVRRSLGVAPVVMTR